MEGADFRTALEDAVQFLEFKLKKERELCLEICFRKDFLGVLPTVYGKSLALPKVLSQYWFNKNGTRRTYSVLVVGPL